MKCRQRKKDWARMNKVACCGQSRSVCTGSCFTCVSLCVFVNDFTVGKALLSTFLDWSGRISGLKGGRCRIPQEMNFFFNWNIIALGEECFQGAHCNHVKAPGQGSWRSDRSWIQESHWWQLLLLPDPLRKLLVRDFLGGPLGFYLLPESHS